MKSRLLSPHAAAVQGCDSQSEITTWPLEILSASANSRISFFVVCPERFSESPHSLTPNTNTGKNQELPGSTNPGIVIKIKIIENAVPSLKINKNDSLCMERELLKKNLVSRTDWSVVYSFISVFFIWHEIRPWVFNESIKKYIKNFGSAHFSGK